MNLAEKSIVSPVDFGSRFVQNFVYKIMNMQSNPYIVTLDKNVNAKSILGLLSANIRKGDTIRIQVMNNYDLGQAESDLEYIINLICGEDDES